MIMADHVEGQGDHTQSAIGQRRQGEGGLRRALTREAGTRTDGPSH
ncbi:hypothetical protein PoMZ_11314 [Pyricularia oryzae]|uniref:Uncharacterized protein n=1 Tax=Pyricularia oryzae TaxID=318829 RepID=A0A4P7NK37_PYROR|nr:hypothetical protein PoMZ_11314 [Pyricularia oryzae]